MLHGKRTGFSSQHGQEILTFSGPWNWLPSGDECSLNGVKLPECEV